MPITDTECPECGAYFHSDDLWYGQQTKCRLGCGEVFDDGKVEGLQ